MKIEIPFEIGETLYRIELVDTDLIVCPQCKGWGYYSWEDDFGGYRSSNCNCSKGMVPKTGTSDLEWRVVEKIVIESFNICKRGITIGYNFGLKSISISNIESYNSLFNSRKLAENRCKKLNEGAKIRYKKPGVFVE